MANVFVVMTLVLAGCFAHSVFAGTPDSDVLEFYTWHFKELNAESKNFGKGTKKKNSDSEYRRFVSVDMRERIKAAQKSEGGLDADPFLRSQDFDEHGDVGMKLSVIETKAKSASVKVEMKWKAFEPQDQVLLVKVIKERGRWKIDDVQRVENKK